MSQIGFVGLGMMGGRVVKRLLGAGHQVIGYNRTQSRADWLVGEGMRRAAAPREAAEQSDVVFSMVSDTDALWSVADGDDGILAGLSPGKIYVDMSTVNPGLVRDLAERTAQAGAAMLEAPVSGSIPAVDSGTLVFFVGGDADALDRVRPILETLGSKIVHMGSNGQGVATKIAINLNLPVQLIALYEGVLLAEQSGIPRENALDALLNSVAASPAMKYRAPFAFNPPREVWFNVAMMQKDVRLALELGDAFGMHLSSARLADEMLADAERMGFSESDFAVLYTVAAHRAGLG